MNRLQSWYFPVLIAVFLFISFYRLASVTLFDVDEAVFSEATKEMVNDGNWITPTYNGVNRYDKPILFYWLMAASYKTFGINEFGARFPSAFTGFLLCLAVFLFGRRVGNAWTGIYASVALSLSLFYFVYSHAAVTDMALTLFITLSLFSFFLYRGERGGSRSATDRYLYGFYLFSSLAFLTKGLIGIVFPFAIAIFYMYAKERMRGVRRVFSFKGFVLFFIVSAPWYGAELAANGMEFVRLFIIKHHFMRYTGVISGHRGPIFYYVPVLIIGLFPWIVFLPGGIRNAVKSSRNPLAAPAVSVSKNRASDAPGGELYQSAILLAFIWLSFIFVFFSLSTTKLPNYVLPAAPAACLLIASGISERWGSWKRYEYAVLSCLSILLGVAFIISRRYLAKLGVDEAGWVLIVAAILIAMAGAGLYVALRKKESYGAFAALMFAFLLVLSMKALPLANGYMQGALHKFSLYAKQSLPAGEKVIVYRINNPSIVFYSDHEVQEIGDPGELAPLLKEGRKLLVIAKTRDLDSLENAGLALKEKTGNYALLEGK
jgi:4-amino-4-deoxy-L-arabinose transferase-like glycosyltransferase